MKDLLDFLELENKRKKLNYFFDYKDIKVTFILFALVYARKTKKVSNKVLVHSLKNISKILKSGDLLIIELFKLVLHLI